MGDQLWQHVACLLATFTSCCCHKAYTRVLSIFQNAPYNALYKYHYCLRACAFECVLVCWRRPWLSASTARHVATLVYPATWMPQTSKHTLTRVSPACKSLSLSSNISKFCRRHPNSFYTPQSHTPRHTHVHVYVLFLLSLRFCGDAAVL